MPGPDTKTKHGEQVAFKDKDGNDFIMSIIDGRPHPCFVTSDHLESIKSISVRDDDIWLVSFPKTGTHWVWEIINMIRQQSAEIEKNPMSQVLVEMPIASNNLELFNSAPSPRLIITHLPLSNLPDALVASKAKVVYPYRNPKDTMVSFYHHVCKETGLMHYTGTWNSFIELSLSGFGADPKMAMVNGQIFHTFEMLQAAQKMPDRILPVGFEAMKKDPEAGVKELADFLRLPLAPELLTAITDKTNIEKLRAAKHAAHKDAGGGGGRVQHDVQERCSRWMEGHVNCTSE